jgi:hypothetical protein
LAKEPRCRDSDLDTKLYKRLTVEELLYSTGATGTLSYSSTIVSSPTMSSGSPAAAPLTPGMLDPSEDIGYDVKNPPKPPPPKSKEFELKFTSEHIGVTLVTGPGMDHQINDIADESEAAKLGLQRYDIVEMVNGKKAGVSKQTNGKPIQEMTHDALIELLAQPERPMSITFRRMEEDRTNLRMCFTSSTFGLMTEGHEDGRIRVRNLEIGGESYQRDCHINDVISGINDRPLHYHLKDAGNVDELTKVLTTIPKPVILNVNGIPAPVTGRVKRLVGLDFDLTCTAERTMGSRDFHRIQWLFGGPARIKALKQWFTTLRENDVEIVICSYNDSGTIHKALELSGLREFINQIWDRPQVIQHGGYYIGKGRIMEGLLQRLGVQPRHALFMDDVAEVLQGMPCQSVWVRKQKGIDTEEFTLGLAKLGLLNQNIFNADAGTEL